MHTIKTIFHTYVLNPIDLPKTKNMAEPRRHHIILDRSGSMYSDLKPIVEIVKGVAETDSGELISSLSSFSSHGDYTLHWVDVTWRQVNEEPFRSELDRIRPTALTCMSQALGQAVDMAGSEIPTVISVFTDGYANHPSPRQEVEALWAIAQRTKTDRQNVAVNMIGYRDWCDWPLMGKIANETGGEVIRATTPATVHEAISAQHATLAGKMRPSVVVDGKRPTLLINQSTGAVIYAPNGRARMIGVGEEDVLLAFEVWVADAPPRGSSAIPKEKAWIAAALAKGLVVSGDLRSGKWVLCASGNKDLWEEHATALTPSTIAGLVADLGVWVKRGSNDGYTMGINMIPKHNLLDLVDAIAKLPTGSVSIDMGRLWRGYRRRSEKKIPGVRVEGGQVEPPATKLVGLGPVVVRSLSVNDADASVQIETVATKRLICWDGNEIEAGARSGISVDMGKMGEFRSYTLMSCGERNVETVPLIANSKEAFDALHPFLDARSKPDFSGPTRLNIVMRKFMAEAPSVPSPDSLLEIVAERFEAKAKTKVLTAMAEARGAGATCPEEEIPHREKLNVSKSGYYNPPTTTAHPDRDQAIQTGELDAFTRYSILFGTTGLMNPKDIESGNELAKRRYEMTLPGGAATPANLSGWRRGASFALKQVKAKKESDARSLMNYVGDEIILRFLSQAPDGRTAAALASEIQAAEEQEERAAAALRPLVLETGCTGLLPLELEEKAEKVDADEFAKRYGKKVNPEGAYYVFGNGLTIGIVPEVSWYTVRYTPPTYTVEEGGDVDDEA